MGIKEPTLSINEKSNVSRLHQALVDKLKSEGYIRTQGVEEAFRTVPRQVFLPGVPIDKVYSDEAIPTKFLNDLPISSSSQPTIMAVMLEQLGLEPGHRVLEIGAGTGYNAALMAHIVGNTGQVVTIDIDQDLVIRAREYVSAAGFSRVEVVCGDGGLGYPSAAPYDRVILTVGAWDIAPAWREQLKPTGRLDQPPPADNPMDSLPFDLFLRSFGPDETLPQRLIGHIAAWDAAGRLSSEGLRIRAYPKDTDYVPSANEHVVVKQWTQLVLDWQ
jgi:protein-L-isoaspartate(D-aspartate) O-methyltransferase